MSSFYPVPRLVNDITNAFNAVVTFTEDHGYLDGQLLRFHVPKAYGMIEISNKQARVLSHTDETITIDIETTNFTPFVYPASSDEYPPNTVPIGSGIEPGAYVKETNLRCTFDHRP